MTLLRRTATMALALITVLGAFVGGVLVAQGRDGSSSTPLRLTGQDLGTGLSCDSLLAWYVNHGADRVTAWGWNAPMMYQGVAVPNAGVGGPATGVEAPAESGSDRGSLDGVTGRATGGVTGGVTGSATGTNVQEAGVDEPDVVKAHGSLLVRVVDDTLTTYDVSGTQPRELGSTPLLGMGGTELLLAGDRAVAIGALASLPKAGAPNGPLPQGTVVWTYDLSDPSHPTALDSRTYDGTLVTARQIGDVVRLVLSGSLPNLPFVAPSPKLTDQQALEANRAVVRRSTLADWLPAVTLSDGTRRQAVDCGRVAVPEDFGGLGTLSVVGFDATAPAAVDVSAVATSSDRAYVSPGHLYVASSPDLVQGCCGMLPRQQLARSTDLYAFDLIGTSARYVGAGAVDGQVTDSWSMDEYDGVLRVAVGEVSDRSSTSVVLLRPESGRLVTLGRLDGLGVDQQLRSVRWFDGLAVLVTFAQVDPFYVVDLADPAHPRVLGALHLPGWSSYLHPVGPHLILGLGQGGLQRTAVDVPPAPEPPVPMPSESPGDPGPSTKPLPVPTSDPTTIPIPPDAGEASASPAATVSPLPPELTAPPQVTSVVPAGRAKATLFDISDPTHPRAVGTVHYPLGSIAQAGFQPHQVTWLPDRNVLLTVLSDGYGAQRAWLSVLTVGSDGLHDRLVPISSTGDLSGVRTVPLTDGRVVLVDGESVRFLEV